jgi:hypothetical protein
LNFVHSFMAFCGGFIGCGLLLVIVMMGDLQ